MTFGAIVWTAVRAVGYFVISMGWLSLMFMLVNKADTLAVIAAVVGLVCWGAALSYVLRWEIMRVARTFAVLLVALLAVGCNKTVPPGYVGLEINYYGGNRGVKDIPIVSGVVWYNPWTTDILQYPTYVQSAVWSASLDEGRKVNEEVTFSNRDQMKISVDVSLSYHLKQTCVPAFYVKFRSDDLNTFTHGFMRNVARDTFDSVGGRYAMDQIMGDNSAFLTEVRKRFQDEVIQFCVELDQFGIIGVPRPPPAVIESINAKATATQNAIRVENELRQATAEAQKRVAQAEGESRATVMRAEGEAKANAVLAQSLTAPIIEWQRLQIQQHQTAKWNGVLPTVTSGATPMLMLGGSGATVR
jgi:regulator of protease activity HflC (stomatin/prohibitin superfamily)